MFIEHAIPIKVIPRRITPPVMFMNPRWDTDHTVHSPTGAEPERIEHYSNAMGKVLESPIPNTLADAQMYIFNEENTSREIGRRIAMWNEVGFQQVVGTYLGQLLRGGDEEIINIRHPLIILAHGVEMLHEHKKIAAYQGIQNARDGRVHWYQRHRLDDPVAFYLSPVFSLEEFEVYTGRRARSGSWSFFPAIAFPGLPDRILTMHQDRVIANLLTKRMNEYATVYGAEGDKLVANHYLMADALAGTFGNWIHEITLPPLRAYLNEAAGSRKDVQTPRGHRFIENIDLTGDDEYADIFAMQHGATTLYDVLKILYLLRLRYTSIRVACCRGHIFAHAALRGMDHAPHIVPSGEPLPGSVPPPPTLTLTLPKRKPKT